MNDLPIQLIYTGGTLGMLPSDAGLAPSADFPALLQAQLETQHPDFAQPWALTSLSPLLDSANMSPREWGQIAEAVRAVADQASRVVVLHGTDTLAFTGAALSFLLADVAVPVVVTGAMLPLAEAGSDALDNVYLSMTASVPAYRVHVGFGGALMPANRAIKMAGAAEGAFVAWHGTGAAVDQNARQALLVQLPLRNTDALSTPRISLHRVMPGEPPAVLHALADLALDGVVLAVYGSGTIPSDHARWMDALAQLCASGAAVVAVSQSPKGVLALGKYAASTPLVGLGVIDGGDMTAEAAYSKLVVLQALGLSAADCAKLMAANLCGERGV